MRIYKRKDRTTKVVRAAIMKLTEQTPRDDRERTWTREEIVCACDDLLYCDSTCPVHGDIELRAPWICGDGKGGEGMPVRIEQMVDRHLLSAIKFTEVAYIRTLSAYLVGPGPNGDAAQDAFEYEFNMLDSQGPTCLVPQYEVLCEEADKRKIDGETRRQQRMLRLDVFVLTELNKLADKKVEQRYKEVVHERLNVLKEDMRHAD